MSERSVKCAAATLCFAVFFATAPAQALPSLDTAPAISLADTLREWVTSAWSALAAAVEAPVSDPDEEPDAETDGGDEGWLIDPNG
jgi:hypothetical protein